MFVSVLLHIALVLLLVILSPSPVNVVRVPAKERPREKRILLQPVPAPSKGGGGSRSPEPPSKGQLPRYARQQFVPPMMQLVVTDPKLAVEPTIVMASARSEIDPRIPLGLPDGIPGPPSGGPGGPAGIGGGPGTSIGDDSGSGVDGVAIGPLRSGMKAPVVLFQLEPEYSEQARKARVQGTVVVEGVIDEKGMTHALKIRDGLGFGLDEQALQAVKRWRFRPAMRDGKPQAITGTFYLTFRLL